MFERLSTLPAMQVTRVRFLVPVISVTLRQEARSQALQLRLQNGFKKLQ
jgi:hypothetical protein